MIIFLSLYYIRAVTFIIFTLKILFNISLYLGQSDGITVVSFLKKQEQLIFPKVFILLTCFLTYKQFTLLNVSIGAEKQW